MRKKGELVPVHMEVMVPCDCTEDEFYEWIQFVTGANGSMHTKNPLSEWDLEARDVLPWA